MLNYDMLNEIDKCIIRHMSEIFNFKVFQLYYVGTICIYVYKYFILGNILRLFIGILVINNHLFELYIKLQNCWVIIHISENRP